MKSYILSQIICAEFEKAFCRKEGDSLRGKAMKVSFVMNIDYDVEDGYRNLEMLIFGAGSNYISVFARMNWSVIPAEAFSEEEEGLKPGYDYTEGETPWVHFSCHDSCWRSDGVENILRMAESRISMLNTMRGGWYETVELSDEEAANFKSLTTATRSSKAPHANDFMSLEFKFKTTAGGNGN